MSAHVQDIDHGWRQIVREVRKASMLEVAVGIHQGSFNADGTSIAEYATYNEYGTADIPSRPFMQIAFEENIQQIQADFNVEKDKLVTAQTTARQALTRLGIKHSDRIKNTITRRNILPRLKPATIAAKRGSTHTLVDTGAMTNSVHPVVRRKGS